MRTDATALLREDLLKLFRVGAIGAAVIAIVIGIAEYAWFGTEYWGSLVASTGTGVVAALFFWLSWRGHSIAASWVLIVGVWLMVMFDSLFQAGGTTHSVVALPLLILVAVWLTGSVRVAYFLAAASVLALLGIELTTQFGWIEQHGVPSPYLGVMVIAAVLFLGSYVALSIYDSYMVRLHEQQQLADSLAQSEHDYRSIFANSIDPFYRADRDGRLVAISPSIERITGYAAEEMIGEDLSLFYADPAQREAFLERLEANGGELTNFEAEIVGRDDQRITISTNAQYWRDHEGNVLGVEGTARDITEWRELQDQIARAGRIEVLDQLSAGLAHNFNNLLAIILGNAEMVKLTKDPREAARLAGIIEQAADRGADLTRRMMSFSSRAVSRDIGPVVVNDLLHEVEPMLATSLGADVSLELRLGEALWEVDSPPGELEDAIINLAINGRDAIPSTGTVTISTRNAIVDESQVVTNPDFRGGECVAIDVEDDGSGVAPALLDKIIEPFFSTKSRDSGTGLGLSMVYGFVRRMQGDITIRSTVDSGTCVTLYLPRSMPQARQHKPPAETVRGRATGRERVLIVEDEAPLRELNEKRLQRLGYRAFSVDSGVAAKAVLESDEPVDIVFSDIVMPGGITGFDLIDIVAELRPGTPVLLCTGYAEEYADVVTNDPVRVLRKPFDSNQLADAIREELDAVAPPSSS